MENLKITQTLAKPDSLIVKLGIYLAATLVFLSLFIYLTMVWMQPLNWFMLVGLIIFLVFAIINIFYLVQYKKAKGLPAIFNEETLNLDNKIIINCKDIKSISSNPIYDKRSIKAMGQGDKSQTYGTLIIKLEKKTYRLYFVDNVLQVQEYMQGALNLQ